jgi:hypothetical protein
MLITVCEEDHLPLEQTQRRTQRVRVGRRRPAIGLLAAGHDPEAVAGLVGWSQVRG